MQKRHLPENVQLAIRCGPVPKLRNWRRRYMKHGYQCLTRAEKIMAFAELHLLVPEGTLVGKPLRLEPFQEAFIYAVFDNPHGTRTAILSMARKNAKTVTCAIILLAFIIGPEAIDNSMISSGAMARDQAAIVFRHMQKFILLSPELQPLVRIVPSSKKITGVVKNVEYTALAKDGSRAVGRSDRVVLGDEWGQITAPNDDFVDALVTGQGAYDDPLTIIISTQAQDDLSYLSMIIDDAIRSQDKRTVCHLYAADPDCELMDETQWIKSNPAIDVFRSRQDIIDKLNSAMRLPASEAKMRNLILNQRVAQSNLFCAPSIWKQNDGPVNLELFKTERVSVGLDLSAKTDLTACVFSAKDPESGQIHQIPYVFVPSVGLEERGRRDRAPYPAWVNGGFMYAIGGNSIEYEQVIDFLKDEIKRQGFRTDIVNFDRWRIKDFQKKCKELGLWDGVEWREVGQGYKDMSPICEDYLANLSDSKIRHGGHPLFNYGIRSTIATSDPAGNIKLDKGKSNTRIDMIVAAVMSHGGLSRGEKKPLDVSAMIG